MLIAKKQNVQVEDTILEKYAAGAPFEAVEMVVADFDGCVFHLATVGETKNLLNVSVSIKIYEELRCVPSLRFPGPRKKFCSVFFFSFFRYSLSAFV